MKKLGLDFAGWLWAINHNKEKEYYADNYGTYHEFTYDVGGRITSQFFFAEPQILAIAYRHLSCDWSLALFSAYPENHQPYSFSDKQNLNMNEITWLLFRALAHNIEMKTIEGLVEGDYEGLWKQLNEKYPDEPIKEEERK